MHTLRFILINTDSAKSCEQTRKTKSCIGATTITGVPSAASPPNGATIRTIGAAGPYPFSTARKRAQDGAYFQRTLAYLKQRVTDPITLHCSADAGIPGLKRRSAVSPTSSTSSTRTPAVRTSCGKRRGRSSGSADPRRARRPGDRGIPGFSHRKFDRKGSPI